MKKVLILITLLVCLMGCSRLLSEFATSVSQERIIHDLKVITQTPIARSYQHPDVLSYVADYIFLEFKKATDSVEFQNFQVQDSTFKNVICSFGPPEAERIIIGAHYDVCGDQPGADDNGSGVAGLLELARLLKGKTLNHRIDLVAFSLEEPPFFGTEDMGSYHHAKFLYDNDIPVKGMICLEMIGYFADAKKTQEYPIGLLKLFYGNRGDYITVVHKFGNNGFSRKFKNLMKKQRLIKTKSLKAPGSLQGISFSDHRNYWKFGYSALMVTDTAFFRNSNYHQKSDTLETLDIPRMSLVIESVYRSVLEIDGK